MSVHHVSIRFICLWILMWIMNAISGSLMSFCTPIEVSMFNVHLSQPTPTTVVFRGTTCACISKESWAKREEEKKLRYLECNDVITCEKTIICSISLITLWQCSPEGCGVSTNLLEASHCRHKLVSMVRVAWGDKWSCQTLMMSTNRR